MEPREKKRNFKACWLRFDANDLTLKIEAGRYGHDQIFAAILNKEKIENVSTNHVHSAAILQEILLAAIDAPSKHGTLDIEVHENHIMIIYKDLHPAWSDPMIIRLDQMEVEVLKIMGRKMDQMAQVFPFVFQSITTQPKFYPTNVSLFKIEDDFKKITLNSGGAHYGALIEPLECEKGSVTTYSVKVENMNPNKYIMIGITWSPTKCATYYSQQTSAMLYLSNRRIYANGSNYSYLPESIFFENGDIIKVIVDMTKNFLAFELNGIYFGPAFILRNVNPASIKGAVDLYTAGDSISISVDNSIEEQRTSINISVEKTKGEQLK